MIFGVVTAKTKKIIVVKTFTLSLVALLSVSPIMAQGVAQDSLLLSKKQQGDKVIEQYLIRNAERGQMDFEMLFPINDSSLQSTFADNEQAIASLNRFAEQAADTTMHISSVKVVGYASPDGVEPKNESLAKARATALANYVRNHCPKSNITTSAEVYSWADCVPAVKASSISDKEAVLAILNSTTHTELQKQAELEKLSKAWMMLKNTILPPMRHSALIVDYSQDKVVQKVVTVTPPAPKPAATTIADTHTTPAPTTAQNKPKTTEKVYPVAVVETDEMGIIVEVPQKEHHHKRKNR